MGFSLRGIGKRLEDILGGVGNEAQHLIGNAGQQVQNVVHTGQQAAGQVSNAVGRVNNVAAQQVHTIQQAPHIISPFANKAASYSYNAVKPVVSLSNNATTAIARPAIDLSRNNPVGAALEITKPINPVTGLYESSVNLANHAKDVTPVLNKAVAYGKFAADKVVPAGLNVASLGAYQQAQDSLNNINNAAEKTGSPVIQTVTGLATGIPKMVLDAPSEAVRAVTGYVPQYAKDLASQGTSNPVKLPQEIKSIADTSLHAFNAAAPFAGAEKVAQGAGEVAAKFGISKKALTGALEGAKGGATFMGIQGLLQGGAESKSNTTPGVLTDAAKQAAIQAAQGAVIGGLTGGLAGGVSGLVNKSGKKVTVRTPEMVRAEQAGFDAYQKTGNRADFTKAYNNSLSEPAKVSVVQPDKVSVKTTPQVGYRSSHQIDSKSSRAVGSVSDLDNIVNDVKSKYGLTNYDQADLKKLRSMQSTPDAEVTIYRASPKNELNSGDWVTTSKTYANDIKNQNGGKVYEYRVKANELNLPANIEGNPSNARFAAFQYNKSEIAPQVGKAGDISPENKALITKAAQEGGGLPDSLLPSRNETVVKATDGQGVTVKSKKLIGDSVIVNELQTSGDIGKALEAHQKATGGSLADAKAALGKVMNTVEFDKGDINAEKNPQLGTINLPDSRPNDPRQAIHNRDSLNSKYITHQNNMTEAAKGITPNDLSIIESHPTAEAIAKADNPAQVQDILDIMKQGYDTRHAADLASGIQTPYRQNYQPQMYDMTDPNTANFFKKTNPNYLPGYTNPQNIPDYATGESLGLKRMNANVIEDFNKSMKSAGYNQGRIAMEQGLEQAYGDNISNMLTRDENGKLFKQLTIPGADHLFAQEDIAREINKRHLANPSTKIGRGYDKATKVAKTAAVGGNPFHGLTEAFRFVGQQVLSPDAWRHPLQTAAGHAKVFAGTFSEKAATIARESYVRDGTEEWSRLTGQTLDRNKIAGDAASKWYDKASKLNPIRAIHESVFGREIPLQKLEIMRQAMKGATDYTNPESLAKAQDVATATNHMFGGLDRATDGLSPQTAKWLSRFVFSGDFTEAKGRLWQDALTKKGTQGNIARQAIIGKSLVMAAPGILALSAAGKINWGDPGDVANKIAGQILDPSLPTPFKTAGGISKIARLSGSDVAEVARVIEPFFNGDPNKLSGVEHYAVARVNPLISPVIKVGYNQDYKGDPVIAHNVDAQGNDLGIDPLGTAKNLVEGSLTSIGTNLAKVAEGKQSLGEAAVNMAGLRTSADPGDPKMQLMSYKDNLVKGLPDQIQKDYASTHPQRTDKNGVVVQDRSFLDSAAKAAALLNNSKLLEIDQKIANKSKELGLPTDPFYNLTKDQQRVVLNLTVDRGFNAGDPVIKRQTEDNPWLGQFYKNRSAYYKSQNIKPDDKNPVDLPAPVADENTQNLLNQMGKLDSVGAAKLVKDNPNVRDYLAAVDQHNRDKRAALGKPQYDKYPEPDAETQRILDTFNGLPKGGGKKGGNLYRSQWIQAHPNEYAKMNNYLTQTALYGLEQSAGQAAFQNQGFDQRGLKDIYNLGQYDIGKQTDANGNTFYALGSGGSQGSSSSKYANSGRVKTKSFNSGKYRVALKQGKKAKVSGKIKSPKLAKARSAGKVKTSIKASLV